VTEAIPKKSDRQRYRPSILLQFDEHERVESYSLNTGDLGQQIRFQPVAKLLCDIARGCLAPQERTAA
jgi:hypothetical protein